jgi:hypothetical protein
MVSVARTLKKLTPVGRESDPGVLTANRFSGGARRTAAQASRRDQ